MSAPAPTVIAASSKKGFDEAVRVGVERAALTLQNIRAAHVLEQKVVVREGKVAEFHVMLEVVLDAVVSVDEAQKIVEFSQGAEVVFGYAEREVFGEHLTILMPERFRSSHDESVRSFGESSVVARMMGERTQIFGLRKDGSEFLAEASILKRTVEGQRRFSVLLRDLTQR